MFLHKIQKIFISGLISFLPLAVTIYIVYAGVTIVENLLGNLIRNVLPPDYYVTGLGFIGTLVLIFFMGLLLNNFVTAGLLQNLQERLTQVPLFKVVYSPLRDLMNLFSKGRGAGSLQKVVLVQIENGNKEVMGLVTRESFHDLDKNLKVGQDKIAVYVPMSYALGGFTMLVNRSQVTPLDIPVEKAMSLALTAWIKTDTQQNTSDKEA